MTRTRMLAFGLSVILTLAVTASTATAVEFYYLGATPTSVLGEAAGAQEFTFGTGSVTCDSAAVEGTIASLKAIEQQAKVAYRNCSSSVGEVAEPIVADYTFDVGGAVFLNERIDITLEGLCTIEIPEYQTLLDVTYGSRGVNMPVDMALLGIEWRASSFLCGEGSDANFSGDLKLMGADGGEWYVE